MPIYEYECTTCGHRFERMVRINADAPPCPECEAEVRKLISPSSFILKGGGWYKDHYGLKSGSSKSEGAASGDKAAPKTESGGAAKDAGASTAPSPSPTPAAAAK
jgi:putative FmdB family regulatory protein